MPLSITRYLPLLSSALIGLIITSHAAPVRAVSFVASRAELNANDELDWATLGPTVGPITDLFPPADPSLFLPNTFTALSAGDRTVGIEIPPADQPDILSPFVFETSSGDFIETNFADGDAVLFTGLQLGPPPAVGNPGPLTLTFPEPVFGVGTQVAAGGTTESYAVTISAFDSSDQLLGSFDTTGSSSEALDDSAVFVGVIADEATIAKLELSTALPTAPLGINQLSLLGTERGASVPEPSLLLGLAVLAAWGYRAQSNQHQ